MNLPKIISELVKAQNNFDSIAYANCFSDNAVVVDEGKTHNGRIEIEHWISDATEKYKTVMKPTGFVDKGIAKILTAEISGTFSGSPALLKYHLKINNGLIQSLKILG